LALEESTMTRPHRKSVTRAQTLHLRIDPETRRLLDRAAKLRGTTRAAFIREAARAAAVATLLDQTIIAVAPEAYAAFRARLDMPPQPSERLRKTLRTMAPWDMAD